MYEHDIYKQLVKVNAQLAELKRIQKHTIVAYALVSTAGHVYAYYDNALMAARDSELYNGCTIVKLEGVIS